MESKKRVPKINQWQKGLLDFVFKGISWTSHHINVIILLIT